MFYGRQCCSCVEFLHDLSAAGRSYQPISNLLSVKSQWAVWYIMVLYTLEQCVFLCDIYVKYDLLESVGENFDVNFVMKEFLADKQFSE
jgi:hypothetical protein